MTDCELVLRFFAFREKKNIKGAVKTILDRCMAANRKLESAALDTLKADLSQESIWLMTSLVWMHSADWTRRGKPSVSQPYYEQSLFRVTGCLIGGTISKRREWR